MVQDAEQLSGGTEQHRMSAEGNESQLMDAVRDTLDWLNVLWDRVSMEDAMRESRTRLVYAHIYDLLDEITISEESTVQRARADIEAHRHAVDDYRRELSMAAFDETIYEPGSITLLNELIKERTRLVAKRNEVLVHQGDVHDKLITLHVRLGSFAPSFEDVHEVILPAAALKELERACEQAEYLLNDRLEAVQKLQDNIKLWIERLSFDGLTEEEFGLLALNFSADGVVVSDSTLQRLTALQDRVSFWGNERDMKAVLEPAWSEWQADVQFKFDELRCRLKYLYEACFVPDDERLLLDDFDAETHEPERLHAAKQAVDSLQQRYDRASEVFSRFAEWHTLWQEKTAAEAGPIDYKGRDLLTRIKRTTDLERLVSRALQELCAAVSDYLRKHPDKGDADLLIGGMRADRRAQLLQEQHKEEKRLAKKKQPVDRKSSNPTGGDRHLHETRRRPLKALRKPTFGNFDVSAIEPVLNHNEAEASSPSSSIGRLWPTATSTPIKHRKSAARLSTKSEAPSTPRVQWK
ncbi:CRE-SPD-1 protein [Aphelenchoides avenae]|nr:CRE-SPD-1 protein [Aphelenchus avenae]